MKKIKGELNELLDREEVIWRQRSHVQCLKEGDANTKFFHHRASARQKKNKITKMKDESNVVHRDLLEIERVAAAYFLELFRSSNLII